ncbi:MAG: substrate-binding domain-containing protein [Puniceicoccales bacterium]
MAEASKNHRYKQPYVIEEISKMAQRYGPGMKLPTAQQLAQQLDVTATTLDRSLAKLEARGIINRRQGSGIFVSNQILKKRIGLVFGQNIFQAGSSTFYLLLLQHCERRAAESNEQFSFYMTPPKQDVIEPNAYFNQDLYHSLKEGLLDGLIICEVRDEAHFTWLYEQDIPVVSTESSGNCYHVKFDIQTLIDLAVKSLVDQGCKTLGFFGILHQHLQAFEKAAAKFDVSIEEKCVIHPEPGVEPPHDAHEPLGRQWMQTCLERCGGKHGLPDGIVISDDIIARGALLHLREQGIFPNKDLHVASHANKGSLVLEYWQDVITMVEYDLREVVDTLFDLLEQMMSGKNPAKKYIRIRPQLRPRPIAVTSA